MPALPADRRISGPRTATALGTWRRPGPAHAALSDALRRAVLAGSLPLSTRMPAERELATALGVSRTTITTAYDTLRSEGFLLSRQGAGTITALPRGDRARPAPAGYGGEGIVDLSIAASAAPPELRAATLAALDRLPAHADHGYLPHGLPELRAVIAQRYTERGTPTTPEQILITTGAQHAIALVTQSHAGPGDRVVVEQPTYVHAIDAVRASGARPVPVPTGPDGVDLALLASTLRQVAPRLVYLVPDFQNPTGSCLDADARAEIRELARRTGTTIVGDEVLTDLVLDGPAPDSWAGDGRNPRVVAIGSVSKSHWGGLRVGWLRGPAELTTRLALSRRSADLGTAVLDQLIATELLSAGPGAVPGRVQALRTGRDVLVDLLRDRLPQWELTVPRGGQSLWVDLGSPVSSALSALALAHGVRLLPGPAFGVDGGLEDRLRLPFTAAPSDLERAVDGLALAWAALCGAPSAPPTPQRTAVAV
ncbi:PLP-dependent aminotransferase family protein [Cellulomonas taurus]|jgi:DNA-binding transcriptional MocR family regulator|uniref:MocR-like transcription factor YczR n=1 Tax=Cellulomonas taurus TaxID=2729175 RepID=UPI00145D27BF|nr:PLP-dependent aminotransferase family protein [Cellulomonas taurus]